MSQQRRRERFALGHGEWVRRWMSERTAEEHAAFFIPYLERGMRVLDCGCGPGSITLDLAQVVAPGEVVGIDRDAVQLEHNGGSPYYARTQRSLLCRAGFVATAAGAQIVRYGTPDEAAEAGQILKGIARASSFVETVLGQGWQSRAEFEEMCRGIQEWSRDPDAFFALVFCSAVAADGAPAASDARG